MSFDWADYLRLAEELSGKPKASSSQEAKLRSAISRAYYAAHGTARNHLRNVDNDRVIPSGAEVHQYVIDKFVQSADKDRVGVGTNLKRLRLDRNRADYEDQLPAAKLQQMAGADVIFAGLILSALKGMPATPSSGGVGSPSP